MFTQRLHRLVLKIPQIKLKIRESQNLATTWGEQEETGREEKKPIGRRKYINIKYTVYKEKTKLQLQKNTKTKERKRKKENTIKRKTSSSKNRTQQIPFFGSISLPPPHVRINDYSVNINTILFQAFPVDLPPAGSV